MTTLRDHDVDGTLPPPGGWRDRLEAMDLSFAWAQRLGLQLVVAVVALDEQKAVRLAKAAGHLHIEAYDQSSAGVRFPAGYYPRGK